MITLSVPLFLEQSLICHHKKDNLSMLWLLNRYIHLRIALRLWWRDVLIVSGVSQKSLKRAAAGPCQGTNQSDAAAHIECPLQHSESELAILESELQLVLMMDVTPLSRQSLSKADLCNSETPRTKIHRFNEGAASASPSDGSDSGHYKTAARRLQTEKHVSQYSRDDVAVALLAKFQRA